ncbi:MAG: TspO/MBR family protein [Rhizobiaceae bacterium]
MSLFSEALMLVGFLAASFCAAATGVIFRPGEWYRRLDKPVWRPPDWLFAPVWSLLYLSIAVSGWLAWRKAGFNGAPLALASFGLQIFLNAAWTPIFFGMRRPGLAFAEIVILWVSIVTTIASFIPISPTAAWLLAPYLLWVSFAAVLNFSIWRRNSARAYDP